MIEIHRDCLDIDAWLVDGQQFDKQCVISPGLFPPRLCIARSRIIANQCRYDVIGQVILCPCQIVGPKLQVDMWSVDDFIGVIRMPKAVGNPLPCIGDDLWPDLAPLQRIVHLLQRGFLDESS